MNWYNDFKNLKEKGINYSTLKMIENINSMRDILIKIL